MTPWHFTVTPACVGSGVDFFDREQEAAALALCGRCEAIDECRAAALHYGDLGADGVAEHGVIAGVAPEHAKHGQYKPAGPSEKRCALDSCRKWFFATYQRRYCSPECVHAAALATKRRSRGAA